MSSTKVIAISGVSGAGKTKIIKYLSNQLNCPHLLFDEYTDDKTYPSNMKNWLAEGADVSLIKTPKLTHALTQLLSTNNNRIILIEEPFGKAREEMATFIDHVIFLDPPLELCLARVIQRQLKHCDEHSQSSISGYLDKYVDHFRDIYRDTASQVRKNCDLVIQENIAIKDVIQSINCWLKSNALN